MNEFISISNLEEFSKVLNGELIDNSNINSVIYYFKEPQESFVIDTKNIPEWKKMPSLSNTLFFIRLKLLMSISGKYVPIYDKYTQQLLYSKEEFLNDRKKMSGLSEYNSGNFVISDNLYFSELNPYLSKVGETATLIDNQRQPILTEIIKMFNENGLSVTLGCNSGGDIELIEAGSTIRNTSVPALKGVFSPDFDFTVRIDESIVWKVKSMLENNLQASGHITQTAKYKVRLTGVTIPGLEKPIDLDFSLTPQKKKYFPSENSVTQRLDNIKQQDENKYKLVLANIMYAKAYLKESGSYKPARAILDGKDRSYGGLGGIGIENWILQNGGSFIDAINEFLMYAKAAEEMTNNPMDEFIEFEKRYAIMDYGQDHVATSKGIFPYDDFIIKNMRVNGYITMKNALLEFKKTYMQTDEKVL